MNSTKQQGSAAKPLESRLFLKKKLEDSVSRQKLENKFSQLRIIQQLQKSIVQQNMHSAMSPLSAISGYLELIDMSLNSDADVDQIAYYREKIESGIHEVNNLIEQLQQVYANDAEQLLDQEDLLVVDLNWMVRDVCNEMHVDELPVEMRTSSAPLHTATDLYTTKLILFKLISYANKCSGGQSQVVINTEDRDEMAVFCVNFELSHRKMKEIYQILDVEKFAEAPELLTDNSMNEGLFASNRLIQQVGGYINFQEEGTDRGELQLFLPLSN